MGNFLLGDRRERTHLQPYFINSHRRHRWKKTAGIKALSSGTLARRYGKGKEVYPI